MPTVYIYLSEQEYVQLAHLAASKGIKASVLAKQAIQTLLEKEQTRKTDF